MPNAEQRHAAQAALQIKRINHRMPPFPCIAVAFSRNDGVYGNKIVKFSNQKTFDTFLVGTIALTRVALFPADLTDVPVRTLLHVWNQFLSTQDEPAVDFFPEGMSLEQIHHLVFGVLQDLATPFEETQMGTSAPADGTTATSATGTTSTEAKAAEKAAAKAAKEQEKADRKAATAAKRADGVIGSIKAALETDKGVTQNEMLDILVGKFPDRTRDGMSSTVKIQFSRLAKSTKRDIHNAQIEGRGRVYKFADKGPVPGKVVTAPAAGEAAAAPAANGTTSTGPVGLGTPSGPGPQGATATEPAKAVQEAPAPKGTTTKTAGKK